jgi:hypothetical protein
MQEPHPPTRPSLPEQAPRTSSKSDIGFGVQRIDFRYMRPLYKLLPSFERGTAGADATLPLWLRAIACLAWSTISEEGILDKHRGG